MRSLDELVRMMAKCRNDVETELRKKIDVILTLCEPYRSYGYAFTFDKSGDLDRDVNRILVILSDALLEDFSDRAKGMAHEDDGKAVAYAIGDRNGMTAQQRLDRHCSRLRYILEGWIAISFVNGWDKQQTKNRIMRYVGNPFGMPDWADALTDTRYEATILAEGDLNRKPGLLNSIIASMSLVGEGIVNDAYCYDAINEMAKAGVERYGVRRASDFPCNACDEVCMHTYPITQIVVPVHPRCVCQTFPVYSED